MSYPAQHWRDSAACRGTDPDQFFPVSVKDPDADAAKAVCARCPVTSECLSFALEHFVRDGIWGGMDEAERDNCLRRQRRANRRAAAA